MTKDDKNVALREAVANGLKRLFDAWTAELAAGTSRIWDGVQQRLFEKATEAPASPPSIGAPSVADRNQDRKAVSNDPHTKI